MKTIKAEIEIYEVNGEEAPIADNKKNLFIKSHWCHKDRIEIWWGNGDKKITVIADDLIEAITRCSGWR